MPKPFIANLCSLPPSDISQFLNRRKWSNEINFEIRFDEIFKDILLTANEFVPSEAGAILLDDPVVKTKGEPSQRLVFIACFGEKADKLLGRRIPGNVGIAGKTYLTGNPYKTEGQPGEAEFFRTMDEEIGYSTHSIVSVPIVIEHSVCGVLELINRDGGNEYSNREMELLRIFAAYISTSIQNALETKRSKELSKIDDLTSLYNDRFFHYSLEQCILNIGADFDDLCLVFLDLDHFKSINDTHGHLAGSRTLTEVGGLLRRVVKKSGAILCRYGGDEFVFVLPGTTLSEATKIAEEVRKAIGSHVYLKTRTQEGEPALNLKNILTASFGVASFRDHCSNPGGIKELQNQFISLADEAMYQAKAEGKNRVVVANKKD